MFRNPDYMFASCSKTMVVRRPAAAAPAKKRAPSTSKVVPKKVTVSSKKVTQSKIQQAVQVHVHINQAASRAPPKKTTTATQQRKKAATSTAVAKRTQNSKQAPKVQYVQEQQYAQPKQLKVSKPRPAQQYQGGQKQYNEEDDADFDHNPNYQFGFDVKDDEFTNYQNRKEQREGNVIKGSYSVVDSDGFIRTVTYTADPKEGFKAEVSRQPTDIVVKIPKPNPEWQQPQVHHQQQQQPQQQHRVQQQPQKPRPDYTQYQ